MPSIDGAGISATVVAGGAALAQHFECADLRREILGLGRAAARRPCISIQQQLKRPAVRHALAERDRGVGVGVDQSGDQQMAGGIDPLGIGGDALSGRHQGHDRVTVDQEIGVRTVEPIRGQDTAALDQLLHASDSTGRTAACSIRRIDATPPSMRKP